MKLLLSSLFILSLAMNLHAMSNPASLEDIHGIQIEGDQLKILVTSTGCTQSDSFELSMIEHHLEIHRLIEDRCRRKPFRTWIVLSNEGNSSFQLVNRITN